MERKRLSRILGKSDTNALKEMAKPIMEKYQVKVIRKPAKTMVMIRMRETVARTQFYLGELLASEALVEVEGKKGFALLAGDDLDKVRYAAVIDGVLKTEAAEKEGILARLTELEQEIAKQEQREIRMHQATRVQFETLDVNA